MFRDPSNSCSQKVNTHQTLPFQLQKLTSFREKFGKENGRQSQKDDSNRVRQSRRVQKTWLRHGKFTQKLSARQSIERLGKALVGKEMDDFTLCCRRRWAEMTAAEQSLKFTHNYLRRARARFALSNQLKYPHTPQLLGRLKLTGSEVV